MNWFGQEPVFLFCLADTLLLLFIYLVLMTNLSPEASVGFQSYDDILNDGKFCFFVYSSASLENISTESGQWA